MPPSQKHLRDKFRCCKVFRGQPACLESSGFNSSRGQKPVRSSPPRAEQRFLNWSVNDLFLGLPYLVSMFQSRQQRHGQKIVKCKGQESQGLSRRTAQNSFLSPISLPCTWHLLRLSSHTCTATLITPLPSRQGAPLGQAWGFTQHYVLGPQPRTGDEWCLNELQNACCLP